jgi:hypothetical protein
LEIEGISSQESKQNNERDQRVETATNQEEQR